MEVMSVTLDMAVVMFWVIWFFIGQLGMVRRILIETVLLELMVRDSIMLRSVIGLLILGLLTLVRVVWMVASLGVDMSSMVRASKLIIRIAV